MDNRSSVPNLAKAARRADVMQISPYERGIGLPSLETCVQLAAILKVSTDELLLGREASGEDLPISDVRLIDKFQRLRKKRMNWGRSFCPLPFRRVDSRS